MKAETGVSSTCKSEMKKLYFFFKIQQGNKREAQTSKKHSGDVACGRAVDSVMFNKVQQLYTTTQQPDNDEFTRQKCVKSSQQ